MVTTPWDTSRLIALGGMHNDYIWSLVLRTCCACVLQVTQKLEVYGSGESNYYYQLDRFISDLKVLDDKHADKQ